MKTEFLKCGKCGWVHFSMTREEVEKSVKEFNHYFDSLSKEDQDAYYNGKKSSVDSYQKCFRCGSSYEEAIPCNEGDAPLGSTIQPLMNKD